VGGAFIGALISVFVRSEHWEGIRLPDRLALRPNPARGASLQTRWTW
jgi:hypothetical protein